MGGRSRAGGRAPRRNFDGDGTTYSLDSIDPALAYSGLSWSILALGYDGLVGFKRVGGLDGGTLVPNLALSIPEPTEGGRTYTFQLREGIRYSNGDPVEPQDFRRAIERVLTHRRFVRRSVRWGAVFQRDRRRRSMRGR